MKSSLAVAALAAVLLTGCSDGSDDAAPATTAGAPTSVPATATATPPAAGVDEQACRAALRKIFDDPDNAPADGESPPECAGIPSPSVIKMAGEEVERDIRSELEREMEGLEDDLQSLRATDT